MRGKRILAPWETEGSDKSGGEGAIISQSCLPTEDVSIECHSHYSLHGPQNTSVVYRLCQLRWVIGQPFSCRPWDRGTTGRRWRCFGRYRL
jgi:hypothetical protein